jgi:hypothetical protein
LIPTAEIKNLEIDSFTHHHVDAVASHCSQLVYLGIVYEYMCFAPTEYGVVEAVVDIIPLVANSERRESLLRHWAKEDGREDGYGASVVGEEAKEATVEEDAKPQVAGPARGGGGGGAGAGGEGQGGSEGERRRRLCAALRAELAKDLRFKEERRERKMKKMEEEEHRRQESGQAGADRDGDRRKEQNEDDKKGRRGDQRGTELRGSASSNQEVKVPRGLGTLLHKVGIASSATARGVCVHACAHVSVSILCIRNSHACALC